MYKFLLAFIALLAISSAAPTCINGTKLVTANFDDLKSPNNGKKPPKGYKGLNWSGGEVEMNPTDGKGGIFGPNHPFNNTSPPNIYRGTQFIKMSTSLQGTLDAFSLKSFNVACFTYISDIYLKPTKCSVLVTVDNYFGVSKQEIKSFMYDYEEDDFKHPTLTTFEVPDFAGDTIAIELVGQPAGKYELPPSMGFYLDNIVTRQHCRSHS